MRGSPGRREGPLARVVPAQRLRPRRRRESPLARRAPAGQACEEGPRAPGGRRERSPRTPAPRPQRRTDECRPRRPWPLRQDPRLARSRRNSTRNHPRNTRPWAGGPEPSRSCQRRCRAGGSPPVPVPTFTTPSSIEVISLANGRAHYPPRSRGLEQVLLPAGVDVAVDEPRREYTSHHLRWCCKRRAFAPR